MKLFAASLFTAGLALAPTPTSALPDIGNQSNGECAVVAAISATEPPTMIDPDPSATALRLIMQCGVQMPRPTGTGTTVSQETLVLDMLPEDACRIGLRWDGWDCHGDGDVWLP